MIVDNPRSHFIFIYHPEIYYGYNYISYKGKPLTNKEYLEHWGKWVILGSKEEFDTLAKKLDPYVEEGTIPCIKYDRVPLKDMGMEECVMCIYCDDREKESVWYIISKFGVRLKAWVYEREVDEMWKPGGRLLEKWIESQSLNVEEAEKVREEARQKFEELYKDENAIFTGWIQ